MDAAARNGYTSKDGEAEARRAIRSGLRNGLRSPRALPDFTTSRPAPDRQQQPQHGPAPSGPARPQRNQAAAAPGRRADRWQDMVPGDIRREIEAADTAASDRRRVASPLTSRRSNGTVSPPPRTRPPKSSAPGPWPTPRTRNTRTTGAMSPAATTPPCCAGPPRSPPSASTLPHHHLLARQRALAPRPTRQPWPPTRPTGKGTWTVPGSSPTVPLPSIPPAPSCGSSTGSRSPPGLILDAKVAHAEGDRQRAQALLGDARQLDPLCQPSGTAASRPGPLTGGPRRPRSRPVHARSPPDHRRDPSGSPSCRTSSFIASRRHYAWGPGDTAAILAVTAGPQPAAATSGGCGGRRHAAAGTASRRWRTSRTPGVSANRGRRPGRTQRQPESPTSRRARC